MADLLQDGDPTPLIARRVKQERHQRGWSLDDLASRAGVSKAMLSKLERCEASPTAALLGRISGALGLTFSQLLADADVSLSRIARAAAQPVWRDPQTGYVRRQVSPPTSTSVHLVEVALPPRKQVGFPASAYGFVRQLVLVRAGTLELHEGGNATRLAAGDCIELGPPADTVFRNPGRETCVYLVIVARR